MEKKVVSLRYNIKLYYNMENIYIIDNDNNLIDYMKYLRPDVANLINSNVSKINATGRSITVCSADEYDKNNATRRGYEEKQCLYNMLILEHNREHSDNPLTEWPSHR